MADATRQLPQAVLRGLAAVLLATQGYLHLRQWSAGFSGIAVIGPLFLVGAVAAFALALALVVTADVRVVGAAVVLSLGQVAAFALASSVGLFGFETAWTWAGVEGAALWAELLASVVLVALGVASRTPRTERPT